MYTINTTAYSKPAVIPYDPEKECGYMIRPTGALRPRSIIIHTTNGNAGTTLNQEARYIQYSRNISSHYLIGKAGEIIQFLNPTQWIAYHAGCVRAMTWSNLYSIGIEMHNTPLEGHITPAQFNALDWLTRQLMYEYQIPKTNVQTHRYVAVFCGTNMTGRKIDPSGFPDNEFYAWQNTLIPVSPLIQYQVINPRGVNVRQSPQVGTNNIAGILYYNDTFYSDVIKIDELNQYHTGTAGTSNKWAHIYKGFSQGQPIDQLGFVSLSNLRQLW